MAQLKQRKKLVLKEHPQSGVYVQGLSSEIVRSAEELHSLVSAGALQRATAATSMNDVSSRSHALMQLRIDMISDSSISSSKVNLVDLAGSERVSETQVQGDRLKEAMKINLSLSALCNVISALVSKKGSQHIPYRDSLLTRLLQDSLGGNSLTLMIATISPSSSSYNETLNTLRYASRAKNIKNRPTLNLDFGDALI